MTRPLSRRGDLAAGLSLAAGLHLAALLMLGGRAIETPPALTPPAAMRVAVRLPPRPRPPAIETTRPAVPQPVHVPRAPIPAFRPETEEPISPKPSLATLPPPIPAPQTPAPPAELPPPAPMPEILPVAAAKTRPPPAAATAPEPTVAIDRENIDGEFDIAPRPRRTIRPVYPLRARQRGESGRVVALLHVSAQGHVEQVAIAASSGYEALDRAARAALLAARFDPARRGNVAVPARVRLTIIFELRG